MGDLSRLPIHLVAPVSPSIRGPIHTPPMSAGHEREARDQEAPGRR